jgi:hypothetical protein
MADAGGAYVLMKYAYEHQLFGAQLACVIEPYPMQQKTAANTARNSND